MQKGALFFFLLLGLIFSSEALANFLPVEKAFVVSAKAEKDKVVVRFAPAPGHYLYRQRMEVAAEGSPKALDVLWPRAEAKEDPQFGKVEVYHDPIEVVARLRHPLPGKEVFLSVSWQGCSEKGLCYPPQSRRWRLIGGEGGLRLADPGQDRTKPFWSLSQDAQGLGDFLNQAPLWGSLLLFLGMGVLLSFTPCVLPLVPIWAGMVLGQERISRQKRFFLSLAYVLAMALAYAFLGMLSSVAGMGAQGFFQHPLAVGVFAALLVILGLAMLGVWELALPASWQTLVHGLSTRAHKRSFMGVAATGALAALIASPCVTPPLAAALLHAAQKGNMGEGAALLFLLGLGMGTPFLLLGVLGDAALPKRGPWMVSVKHLLGFGLLAAAVLLVSRLWGQAQTLGWALWGAGLASWALWRFLPQRAWMRKGAAAAGALVFLAALLAFPPWGLSEAGKMPLASTWKDLEGEEGLNLALMRARQEGQGAVLDFYADWCLSCQIFEKNVLADRKVQKALSSWELLRADVTGNDTKDRSLMRSLGVAGPPTVVLFGADGKEKARLVGEVGREKFLAFLGQGA